MPLQGDFAVIPARCLRTTNNPQTTNQVCARLQKSQRRKLIMKNNRPTMLVIPFLAAVLIGLATLGEAQKESAATPHYTVTNLGTLGGVASSAHSVNDRGWVAGVANVTGDTAEHASLWRNGVVIDLGTLGGVNSNVDFPVKNDGGLIAGFAQTSTQDPLGEQFCTFACTLSGGACEGSNLSCRGFLWQNGVMTSLPTLGGNNSAATGVNNQGLVVGAAENSTQDPNCVPPQVLDYEAVIWGPEKGEVHELPTFPGDSVAVAVAINDYAQVVGGSGSCGSGPGTLPIIAHALLWQTDSVTDLGSLGGVMNNLASAINNYGQVVGMSDLAADTTGHAFLWQNGVMSDLGTLPGDFSSSAFGINDKGQVVGLSCDQTGNCRAFLWQNGVMTDLNTLVPPTSSLYLIAGFDINDGGEIVGAAFDPSTGEAPAFLAIPQTGWSPAQVGGNSSPRVILPENVRKSLQRQRVLGRFALR
jgi:probable HAF family extracellular repeat protein